MAELIKRFTFPCEIDFMSVSSYDGTESIGDVRIDKDMDFKVGGTKDGITAIQVDIKIDGLTYDIIKEAFERTKKARDYILDEIMLKQIAEPRKELSKSS